MVATIFVLIILVGVTAFMTCVWGEKVNKNYTELLGRKDNSVWATKDAYESSTLLNVAINLNWCLLIIDMLLFIAFLILSMKYMS